MRFRSCDPLPAYEWRQIQRLSLYFIALSRCWPVPPLSVRLGGWQGANLCDLVGGRCLRRQATNGQQSSIWA
ncbi:hypothetical protein BDV09DRAFT_177032 [Aspergillus tetrazonus]